MDAQLGWQMTGTAPGTAAQQQLMSHLGELMGLGQAPGGFAGFPSAFAAAAALPAETAGGDGMGSDEDEDGPHAGPRARRRNASQQERNRQAQQRYRERKKAKQVELEWTVKQLQQQAASMAAMQQRTQILEGMNSELQSQLAQKQCEAERLKRALCEAAEARAAAEGAQCFGRPTAAATAAAAARGGSTVSGSASASGEADALPCCAPAAAADRAASTDLRSGLQAQTAELKAFLEEHRLASGDGTGQDLPDEVISRCTHLVCRGHHLCLATEHVEGPGAAPAKAEVDWDLTLATMALSPAQHEAVLLLRSAHLEQLRAIYQERQALNMQAMALMLPAAGGFGPGAGAGLAYEAAAKRSTELEVCLDKVKDNLRREQRAVLEFKGHVISRILTPLQAARYMVAAHPHHCDVLALTNALARQTERGTAPAPPTGGAP